jgi:ATP-dependent DNA ligase
MSKIRYFNLKKYFNLKLTIFTGITLIEVPYWWDDTFESLCATIYNHRPDLFLEPPMGTPIPSHLEIELIEAEKQLKKIQRNIQKQPVMEATEWDVTMNPTGWWVTEKYDGVRILWDGASFFTKAGTKIEFPKFIADQFPAKIPLDCELW